MSLYLIDKNLFVDKVATELDPEGIQRPRIGLPASVSEIYNIMGLLWGDYTYLADKTDLSIGFGHMFKLWAFSWLQLFISAVADPIMLVWSAISVASLINVIFYDVAVLGISFDDAFNDPKAAYESYYGPSDGELDDAKKIGVDIGDDDREDQPQDNVINEWDNEE